MNYEKKKVLVTVKAYPEKSKKYGASVCTAGITDQGEFIRLYPIPFENFRGGKSIPKYSWITVECKQASEYLMRKESYRVRYENIKIGEQITTKNNWNERNKIVLPLLSNSLEELKKSQKDVPKSLGIIKPKKILDFTIDEKWRQNDDEDKILKGIQLTLDGEERTKLENIPYNFRYQFYCDIDECSGHNIMCEDWEMLQAWRSWKQKYKDRDKLVEKFKKKFYYDMIENKDLYFFLGTHSQFNTWIIIGLYYPPKIK